MMTKICTWLPASELEAINRLRGDISASLFVRRAIQKAINDIATPLNGGGGLPNHNPPASAAISSPAVEVNTTTTHPGSAKPKEAEAVV